MTQKADKYGMKKVSSRIVASIYDRWRLYKRKAKRVANENMERTNGGLILSKAVEEYMINHPLK